jgi:hypothetical protein
LRWAKLAMRASRGGKGLSRTNSRILFGGTVFLASFLLFLVEPIAAKQLLPVLGGSAAVWITCLVFFQTALLCGYAYAHWLTRHARWNRSLILLALATVSSIVWAARSVGSGSEAQHPFTAIFLALGLSIGLPFLVLGATSPLLQVWWSRVETGGIPYKLYALSNLASLLALGLYPTVIEPHLSLHAQRAGWCCGFNSFGLLYVVLTWKTRAMTASPEEAASDAESEKRPATPRQKLLWVLLPMGAAMQLSAVTSYLTANVAAIPMLWILPLAVYLITLIVAFQFPRLAPRGIVTRFLIVMLAGLGYMLSNVEVSVPMRISIILFLCEVFFACLFCHREAYELRPGRSSESTLFYLLFAAGGALGSFLIGVVSPLIFSANYDLELTFVVTALLALAVTWSSGWNQRLLWGVASMAMAVLVFMVYRSYIWDSMVSVRNFYGSLRVKQDHSFPGATVRTLTNGTIQHGTEIFGTDQQRKMPTTYYGEDSGVGIALRFCCGGAARNIGVIGLGAGTLAAYGHPGDRIRFYEINPAVEPIARNLFAYIRESQASEVKIVEGDARTSLAQEPPQGFNVLAVDAFSGDAIPLHLLTTEAVALYRRHLAPGGILAFHISNQHVNLEPAVASLARAAGMRATRVSSLPSNERGEFSATWILLSDNPAFFAQPEVAAHSAPREMPGLGLWTDDYSSLLPVIRW